jgi:hypothetical protein
MLHDCISKHDSQWWSFASAFEAAKVSDYDRKHDDVFDLLVRRGLIRAQGRFETGLRKKIGAVDGIPDIAVTVTDLGRAEAVRLVLAREPKTLTERLHSINWSTWGGLAAVVAAIASTVGAYFAFKAVP